MAIEGELIGLKHTEIECMDCKSKMLLGVQRSGAGCYLGYFCNNCGPYSRETGYMTSEDAEKALDRFKMDHIDPENKRDEEYHGQVDEEEFEEGHNDFGDDDDRSMFADPGGNSALRAASSSNPRNIACPTCGEPDRLTPEDKKLGYQCNSCADALEGGY